MPENDPTLIADYERRVDPPYVWVCLTQRQWDIVRDACYQRKTKQAAAMGQRIWEQGGGTPGICLDRVLSGADS